MHNRPTLAAHIGNDQITYAWIPCGSGQRANNYYLYAVWGSRAHKLVRLGFCNIDKTDIRPLPSDPEEVLALVESLRGHFTMTANFVEFIINEWNTTQAFQAKLSRAAA